MKGEQQQVKKAAQDIGTNTTQETKAQLQTVMQHATRKGTSPKDSLGLTDAMIEGIYGQAYRLYNTGKFRDASQLFRMLIMINASEPKYAMGLAASFHMLKEYKNAAETYAILALIDANSPVPYFHASDCYIQLKDPASAMLSLNMAIQRAGDKPEFRTLKDRALMTVEGLKKELASETAVEQS